MFETIGIGNLGADPEAKHVGKNNTPLVELFVYFNDLKVTGSDGKEKTPAVKVNVWSERDQEWLMKHAKKGSRVQVSGTPKMRVFQRQDGSYDIGLEMNAESIKFRSFGGGQGQNQNRATQHTQQQTKPQQKQEEAVPSYEDAVGNFPDLFPNVEGVS